MKKINFKKPDFSNIPKLKSKTNTNLMKAKLVKMKPHKLALASVILVGITISCLFLIMSLFNLLFSPSKLRAPHVSQRNIDQYNIEVPNSASGLLAFGEAIHINLFTTSENICGRDDGIKATFRQSSINLKETIYPVNRLSACINSLEDIYPRFERVFAEKEAFEAYYLPVIYIKDGNGKLYALMTFDDFIISNSIGYQYIGSSVSSIHESKTENEQNETKAKLLPHLLQKGTINLYDKNLDTYLALLTDEQKLIINNYLLGNLTNEQYSNLKIFNGQISDTSLQELIKRTLGKYEVKN